jgi:hypothetical protein
MPSQKTKTKADVASQELVTKLYDSLMEQIEPDLKTDSIDMLDFLYVGENAEERVLRMERYAKAIALFEERFDYLLSQWNLEVKKFRDVAMAKLKSAATQEESEKMSNLNQAFDKI